MPTWLACAIQYPGVYLPIVSSAPGQREPDAAEEGEQRGAAAHRRAHRVGGEQVPGRHAEPDERQQREQDQPDRLEQVRHGVMCAPRSSPTTNSTAIG